MFKEVLLFGLIGIALGAPRTHSKLERKSNYKIIGGLPANISDFPWQVSIAKNGVYVSGGFLVASDWVVTVGSTASNSQRKNITVRVGSNHRDEGGKLYQVSQSIVNPNFDFLSKESDIGLLKLSTPVDPSLGSAIELPEAKQSVPDQSSLVVTGYGTALSNGSLYDGLLQATIPKITHQKCVDEFGHFTPVSDNAFCAQVLSGGTAVCDDDAGSAAVLDGKAVGIVSWVYYCNAQPGYPGVYTQVSNYLDWINRYVK